MLRDGLKIERVVSRRKKRLVDLGEGTFCLREAGSYRPAFCIQVSEPVGASGDPVDTEWLHSYTAMGLLFQHRRQAVLLARTYDLGVAVCFVRAIGDILGCGVRSPRGLLYCLYQQRPQLRGLREGQGDLVDRHLATLEPFC